MHMTISFRDRNNINVKDNDDENSPSIVNQECIRKSDENIHSYQSMNKQINISLINLSDRTRRISSNIFHLNRIEHMLNMILYNKSYR